MHTVRPRLQVLLAALVAALSLVVAPSVARADGGAAGPVAAGGADVATAISLGEQHWGQVPCGGQFRVTWTAQPDPLLNGTSLWTNPRDLWTDPADNGSCVVELNPNATWDWPKLCTVVAHELGHLLGHQHAADPADLMAAVYSVPLPACVATPEPEGTLTAATQAAATQAAQAQAAQQAQATLVAQQAAAARTAAAIRSVSIAADVPAAASAKAKARRAARKQARTRRAGRRHVRR